MVQRTRLDSASVLGLGNLAEVGISWTLNSSLALYSSLLLNANYIQVGLVISLFFVSALITKLVSLLLLPPQLTFEVALVSSYGIWVALAFYSLASSVDALITIRIVHGVLWSLNATSLMTLASVLATKGRQARAITQFSALGGLGSILGPALITAWLATFGLRSVNLVPFSLALLIPLSLHMVRGTAGARRELFGKDPNAGLLQLGVLRESLRSQHVRGSVLSYLAYSYTYVVLLAVMPLHAKVSLGMSEQLVVTLFSLFAAVSTLSRFAMMRFFSHLQAGLGMTLSLVMISLLLVSMSLTLDPLVYALSFVAMGWPHGVSWPSAAILIASAAPARARLPGNTTLLAGWDGGIIAGPIVASLLVANFGVRESYQASVLAPLVGIFVLWKYKVISCRRSHLRSEPG